MTDRSSRDIDAIDGQLARHVGAAVDEIGAGINLEDGSCGDAAAVVLGILGKHGPSSLAFPIRRKPGHSAATWQERARSCACWPQSRERLLQSIW